MSSSAGPHVWNPRFKKRPFGVKRYTPGYEGKGAMVIDMQVGCLRLIDVFAFETIQQVNRGGPFLNNIDNLVVLIFCVNVVLQFAQ